MSKDIMPVIEKICDSNNSYCIQIPELKKKLPWFTEHPHFRRILEIELMSLVESSQIIITPDMHDRRKRLIWHIPKTKEYLDTIQKEEKQRWWRRLSFYMKKLNKQLDEDMKNLAKELGLRK